jgi:rubrerythrin
MHTQRSCESTLRRLLLRLVTPVVWRIPGHGARKLYSFAKAEQGSRIDLLQAAQLTSSLPRRALYLRHAIDETRHAAMFWRRANELRADDHKSAWPPPQADTEALFTRLGESRFLAFVHRGEKHGREQFELYATYFQKRGDTRTATLFEAILVDEQRHESYTHELLVDIAGDASAQHLRRAAMWQAWRTWRRAGRSVANVIYVVVMTLIYLVFGPLLAISRRFGRKRAQWQLSSPITTDVEAS